MIPRDAIDSLRNAPFELVLHFYHVVFSPIKICGSKVDRVEPDTKREHECVLDIVFGFILPLLY